MRLYQYWNDPSPPPDVLSDIEGIRSANPELDYQLLNEATAEAFIALHYGSIEVEAFKACGHPAMQADYLRLCLMDSVGGLYLDADLQSGAPLASMLGDVPHGLLSTWNGLVGNGVLMFRQPRHPYIRACLALATDNIANRRFSNVLVATGPGVFNVVQWLIEPRIRPVMEYLVINSDWRLWGWFELLDHARRLIEPTPELCAAFAGLTRMDTATMSAWLVPTQPAYKATDRHWMRWTQDIYRR